MFNQLIGYLLMLSMSKLRIIPSILGRVIKPGTFSSKAEFLTYPDGTAPILKIPVIKTFEHLNCDWKPKKQQKTLL